MYGLIGYPLGHSFSRKYFSEKFEREGIPETYELFELRSIEELPQLLDSHRELRGLNVTIPYKTKVIPYLDSLQEGAGEIQAVNVINILRDEDGNVVNLRGYNTDYIGFQLSLRPLLTPDIRRALVLGNGGAAKAVVYALEQLGIKPTIVSRNPEPGMIGYSDLDREIMESHLLVVNTTPLGMYPNIDSAPDIPYRLLSPKHLCYDLVYNPETTRFMQLSSEAGAGVKNGLEMLHIQAQQAWAIWQKG